jgi:hypothetical protein
MTTLEEAWGSNFKDDMKKYKKITNKYRDKKIQKSMLQEHDQGITSEAWNPQSVEALHGLQSETDNGFKHYTLNNDTINENITIEIKDDKLKNHLKKYSKEYQSLYVSNIIRKYIMSETPQEPENIEFYSNYDHYENNENNDDILLVIVMFLLMILLGEKLLR